MPLGSGQASTMRQIISLVDRKPTESSGIQIEITRSNGEVIIEAKNRVRNDQAEAHPNH